MKDVLLHAIKIINESCDNCNNIPDGTKDPTRFFTFLTVFMGRIRNLQESESVIIPAAWLCDDETQHAVLFLVTRVHEDTEHDYSVTIINTSEGGDKGLDYHAANVDCATGATLRNIAFELPNIPTEKINNTAFW